MPVVIEEYPKWIEHEGEQKLVKNEDEFRSLEHDAEKDRMIQELTEDYGKEINLSDFEGPAGRGALMAYYESVKAQGKPTPAPAAEPPAKPEKKATKAKPPA
jgi:hypothetical protein